MNRVSGIVLLCLASCVGSSTYNAPCDFDHLRNQASHTQIQTQKSSTELTDYYNCFLNYKNNKRLARDSIPRDTLRLGNTLYLSLGNQKWYAITKDSCFLIDVCGGVIKPKKNLDVEIRNKTISYPTREEHFSTDTLNFNGNPLTTDTYICFETKKNGKIETHKHNILEFIIDLGTLDSLIGTNEKF